MHIKPRCAAGFSLLEAIFAIGLLATTLITFAQLVSVGVWTDALARHATLTSMYAAEKLEQLRSAQTVDPTAELMEFLDSDGNVVCGFTPCPSAVYLRRWSVQAFTDLPETVAIQVRVRHRAMASREARLSVVRSRVRE